RETTDAEKREGAFGERNEVTGQHHDICCCCTDHEHPEDDLKCDKLARRPRVSIICSKRFLPLSSVGLHPLRNHASSKIAPSAAPRAAHVLVMPMGSTTSASAVSLALPLDRAEIQTSATGTNPKNSPTPLPSP